MSVKSVAEAIVALANTHKTTLGLAIAKDPPPPALDTASLPALFVWTGPAQYTALGSGLKSETRLYRVQVAVAPEGEASPDLLEARTRPILAAVRDLYLAWPQLKATTGVQISEPVSDSGVMVLPEYGGAFVGFELRLQVTEYIKVIYQE